MMNNEYDSILKEKSVYVDEVSNSGNSSFKRFIFLGLFLSFVVIVISYVVYYNSVLSGESIILNDILKLKNKYGVIGKGINFNYDLSSNYTFYGDIKVDNFEYNYSFIQDNGKIKRMFNNDSEKIIYYYDGDGSYVNFSSLGNKYISIHEDLFSLDRYSSDFNKMKSSFYNYFSSLLIDSSFLDVYNMLYNFDNYNSVILNITNNFSNYMDDSKYDKKFYFDDGRPVVSIRFSLNTKDINNILGSGDNNLVVRDDVSVNISILNDAILNNIKLFNITFLNNTDKERSVIKYDGNDLLYISSSGTKYKYNISSKGNKTFFKIDKDDVLYSVLELKKDGNKYIYNYNVIDELTKISLVSSNKKNKFSYKFSSIRDNVSNDVIISGNYSSDGAIREDVGDVSLYRDLGDEDRSILNSSIKMIFG